MTNDERASIAARGLNRYEVTETMVYEVWAEDEDQAVAIIENDVDRDDRGPACIEREAVLDLTAEDAAKLGRTHEWSAKDRALAGVGRWSTGEPLP